MIRRFMSAALAVASLAAGVALAAPASATDTPDTSVLQVGVEEHADCSPKDAHGLTKAGKVVTCTAVGDENPTLQWEFDSTLTLVKACTETTTVTADTASPLTIKAGDHRNILFAASSSTTWTWTVGSATFTKTKDTTTPYRFTVTNSDGLSAGPVVTDHKTAAYDLPVGTYTVTAAHKAKQPYCPAKGTTQYVINAVPTPTPTVTVTTPGPTSTVVVTPPARVITVSAPVTANPSFTG